MINDDIRLIRLEALRNLIDKKRSDLEKDLISNDIVVRYMAEACILELDEIVIMMDWVLGKVNHDITELV